MLTSETKRRIDACRDVLVGKLPLPTDQVELITLALIYKFMDDLDEEAVKLGGKRSFFIAALAKYRWRSLLPQTVSAEDRVKRFAEGVEALGDPKRAAHLPALFRDIFRNAFLKFRDGRVLTLFLTEVNALAYSHSEELGNAFEYLLQCMGTQGENGQFRTPRHIIDFMVACLEPQPTDKILDPACGTGGFLVSCYKHILKANTSPGAKVPGDKLTHVQRKKVYASLAGYDVTDLMVKLSKVNLFLHGFPDPAIHIYDTLTNDARWNEKVDLILANPPFMTPKGGVTPHSKFRISAKKTEVLFTDYIAEHITADGRGGVIVPNGIVATKQNAYTKLRRFLVEDSLVAVVSLPAGIFKPYSGVKTSILFLDKKLARERDEVLFLKINADGFDLGDQRRKIDANDLPEAERVIKALLKGKAASAIGTILTSKAVEKIDLLKHPACSLQAELFFGEKLADSSVEMVTLADVAAFSGGGTPSKSNSKFWQGDIPWVSPKDMKSLVIADTEDHVTAKAIESGATKLLPSDTVLCVVRSGILQHTFPVAITARPVCINQDLLAITPNKARLDPKFLLFVLKGRSTQILRDGIKSGVTVQSFHNGFFKTLEIPLPSLEEQRRIVEKIENYQKVIDGAGQILESYSPQITPHADWESTTIGEVCDGFMNGLNFSKDQMGHGVKFVNIKDVFSQDFIKCENLGLVDVTPREVARCLVRPNDLLFVRSSVKRDGVGYTSIMPEYSQPVVFCGFIIKCTPKADRVVPKYLFYLLRTPDVRHKIVEMSSTAAITNISQDKIQAVEIPLPPLDEQRRIVAELDAEAAQITAVRALIPRFKAKIQTVMDGVWGIGEGE